MSMMQGKDLPAPLLISRAGALADTDVGEHQHMADALAPPSVPDRVCGREGVGECLARYEVQHDFIRVMPHGIPFMPIFSHVISFPSGQARGIYSDEIDQYRRRFQRFIQADINRVLADRSRFARFARTAAAQNRGQYQEDSSRNQSRYKPVL